MMTLRKRLAQVLPSSRSLKLNRRILNASEGQSRLYMEQHGRRSQISVSNAYSDAQARKAKNKAKDKRLKAAKGKARAAAVIEPEEDEEPSEDEAEETMTSQEPIASSSKSKKINFLDPAVFEDAATYFQPEKQPAAGQGKMAAKKQARAEKRAKREAAEERATRIGTGGARQVE